MGTIIRPLINGLMRTKVMSGHVITVRVADIVMNTSRSGLTYGVIPIIG